MPKKQKWISTNFPGVRYREHSTRKYGINKDRYFVIRYQKDSQRREEKLGWSSDGWTAELANSERAALKKAHITGEGAESLKEKQEIKKEKQKQQQHEKKRLQSEMLTFDSFFTDTYLPLIKTDKNAIGVQKEEGHFNNWLKPVVGNLPIKDIKPFHIEKIKKSMLNADRAPRTIQYALAIFRQIWNLARINGLVSADTPTRQVKIPTINNDRQRFLSHDEAEALLKEVRKKSEQTYQMTLLSLHCGLRASEIFNLTFGDIIVDKGLIMLRDTKGGKSGVAFMTDEIKKMFNEMPSTDKNALIFHTASGKKITAISNTFRNAANNLGLNDDIADRRQKIVFHSCRHTYASWLVESGIDLYTVQKLMRHSNFKMTERYAHLSENTLQNAVKRFESKMPKKKTVKRQSKVKKFVR